MSRRLSHHDNWTTPKYLYDQLDSEFHFDFDPCPLHADFDGLSIEWGRSNFVNPPYSKKLKGAFVIKAIEEANKGKRCVILIPVSTSTDLFHDVIKPNANEIRFIRGRVKFVGINDKGEVVQGVNSMHDSMLVIF